MIGSHPVDPYPGLTTAERIAAATRDDLWETFPAVTVYANWGLWVADCPRMGCMGAEHHGPSPTTRWVGGLTKEWFRCSTCFAQGPVIWPTEKTRLRVEGILSDRPYFQHRNWWPSLTVAELAAANATPWHFSWTAPATATTGNTLTAAFWNAQVRDNMLETGAATAAAAGDLVYADAANSMGSRLAHPGQSRYLVSDGSNGYVARQPVEDTNWVNGATSATLQATSYTPNSAPVDAEVLPTVTVTTGTLAIVVVSCSIASNDTAGASSWVAFSISGATTQAAADALGGRTGGSAGDGSAITVVRLVALTAGSNTFQMEAKVSSGTATIQHPRVLIMPL